MTSQIEDFGWDAENPFFFESMKDMIVSSHSIIESWEEGDEAKVRDLFKKESRSEKNEIFRDPNYTYCTKKTNQILTLIQSPHICHNL